MPFYWGRRRNQVTSERNLSKVFSYRVISQAREEKEKNFPQKLAYIARLLFTCQSLCASHFVTTTPQESRAIHIEGLQERKLHHVVTGIIHIFATCTLQSTYSDPLALAKDAGILTPKNTPGVS